MLYTIHLFGSRAVCPSCSGLLTEAGEMKLHCYDCGSLFKMADVGPNDKQGIYEMVRDGREGRCA